MTSTEPANWAWLASEPDNWQRLFFGDVEFGEVSWLRRDERYEAGLLRLDSSEYRDFTYTVAVDQFGIVLEGSVTVEIDGESVELGVGDTLSVPRGSTVRTHFHGERYREFFIQIHPEDAPRPDTDAITTHTIEP